MNIKEALRLVISRRARIEYSAWEQWATGEILSSRIRSGEVVLPTSDNLTHADRSYVEDLNADWRDFNGGRS